MPIRNVLDDFCKFLKFLGSTNEIYYSKQLLNLKYLQSKYTKCVNCTEYIIYAVLNKLYSLLLKRNHCLS